MGSHIFQGFGLDRKTFLFNMASCVFIFLFQMTEGDTEPAGKAVGHQGSHSTMAISPFLSAKVMVCAEAIGNFCNACMA